MQWVGAVVITLSALAPNVGSIGAAAVGLGAGSAIILCGIFRHFLEPD